MAVKLGRSNENIILYGDDPFESNFPIMTIYQPPQILDDTLNSFDTASATTTTTKKLDSLLDQVTPTSIVTPVVNNNETSATNSIIEKAKANPLLALGALAVLGYFVFGKGK